MEEETLEYLEKVLAGLKARFISGDKSVEAKLRAVAAKIDRLKLQSDLQSPTPATTLEIIKQQMKRTVQRKSCCR